MANTLTLEQAARQLGLTVEQFKVNLKTHKDFKSVRPLMGGTTMHFREQDVQEFAQTRTRQRSRLAAGRCQLRPNHSRGDR